MMDTPQSPDAAQRPLWGSLLPGPYGVGFQTFWRFDHARIYDPPFPGDGGTPPRRPRPILVNVWYPARQDTGAAPMRHGEYLDLGDAPEEATDDFIRRLAAFNRDVICQEVMGKDEPQLNAAEKGAFEEFLRTPTAAIRDAIPAGGRFPLAINHQGLGGAFEDNAVFFEYLASHGYVVVNSAYQSENAAWLNLDWDLARSIKDLDFLVNIVAERPDVDLQHVGIMGQSYGGQAALAWRAEKNSLADAVVSLDSTIEYIPDDFVSRSWDLLKERLSRVEAYSVPMLLFASRDGNPNFARTDPLKHSERFYARVAHLQHNDYICHGAIGSDIRRRLRPEDAEAALVREGYDRVCVHARLFFDAFLTGDAGAAARLRAAAPNGGTGTDAFTLEHRAAVPLPPSGKQLADAALSAGVAEALALCERLAGDLPEGSLNDAGRYLLREGHPAAAIPLFRIPADRSPASADAQEMLGEAYAAQGDTVAAIQSYQKALDLLSAEAEPTEETKYRMDRLSETLEKLKKQGAGGA